jgi:hypothetical protein
MRRGLHFEVNGNDTNICSPTTAELLASARRVGYLQPFDIAWEAVMHTRPRDETENDRDTARTSETA